MIKKHFPLACKGYIDSDVSRGNEQQINIDDDNKIIRVK